MKAKKKKIMKLTINSKKGGAVNLIGGGRLRPTLTE